MFKYSDLDYDNFYSSEHCQMENAEICKILHSVCDVGDKILDLGAGTGLVSALIGDECEVWQIDNDPQMIQQNINPRWITIDALEYERLCRDHEYDHVVSVFSVNYMKSGTITEALRVSGGKCLFVMYDRPYLQGSSSFYTGRKIYFLLRHFAKKCKIKKEIERISKSGCRIEAFNLMKEPYYKVVILG